MSGVTIPTMPCPQCDGKPRLAEYLECGECYGIGRVARPPLTPDQVAALLDGAKVVAQRGDHGGVIAGELVFDRGVPCLRWRHGRRTYLVGLSMDDRVWLAEDGGERR